MNSANELKDLELLISSRYPLVLVEAIEEQRVERALSQVAASLGVPLFRWTVVQGLQRTDSGSAVYDTQDPAKALANIAAFEREGIYYLKDLERFLEQPAIERLVLDLVENFSRDHRALVLSGTGLRLPASIEPFAARLRLPLPERPALKALVRRVLESATRSHGLSIEVDHGQLDRLVDGLAGLSRFEAERLLNTVVLDDRRLTAEDIDEIVRRRHRQLAEDALVEVETPEAAHVEVAGMANLRRWIGRRELRVTDAGREFGLEAPRGILLLGVQGCGKSAAAATIAAEWQVPLVRLEVARLYDRFIGETEQRLERALAAAERLSPCVLLLDEIEKALAAAGSSADGGLSRRVMGRLLTWLQEREAPIFVVATCNAVQDLPPELMRKGRFDEVFFVDLPDPAERAAIFALHLERRRRSPDDHDLERLAAASAGFSGAEIEAAIVAALHAAFADCGPLLDRHLLAEIGGTRPLSVLRAEEIAALRRWAEGRTVPAGGQPHAA